MKIIQLALAASLFCLACDPVAVKEDKEEVVPEKKSVLWDFDSTGTESMALALLSDMDNGGSTAAEISSGESSGGKTGKLSYKLHQGGYEWAPYATLFLHPKSGTLDCSKYRALQFRHRGCGMTFSVNMSAVKDYAYHETKIDPSGEWRTVTVVLDRDLNQPDWAGTVLPFDAGALQGLSWMASGKSGEYGSFEIDDVTLLEEIPEEALVVPEKPLIRFNPNSSDLHEEYLNQFDSLGIQVMLGVESGDADLVELMDIVMKRYGHHKSVIGYCLDIEWITKDAAKEGWGTQVSDSLAELLDRHLKTSYGRSDLQLMLKHWDSGWLPATYRSDIIFLNDGQKFASLQELVGYMGSWFDLYSQNSVLFQVGYPADHKWWKDLEDPIAAVGNALAARRNPGQKTGMLWVDFSVNFPEVNLLKYNPADPDEEAPGRVTAAELKPLAGNSPVDFAGIRCSSYGGLPGEEGDPSYPYEFPRVESDGWNYAARNMIHQFPGSKPLMLWGVGHIDLATNACVLEFPRE